MKFSNQDRALLEALQSDASLSLADLAERSGMGTSTVWRKVQEFKKAGLIRGRVALLDPRLAGAKLCVFAQVSLKDHSEEAVTQFAALVARHPEIMEAHALTGTSDYILKIRCADVEEYEHFMSRHLLRASHVGSVVSSFSLREIKYTTQLPL